MQTRAVRSTAPRPRTIPMVAAGIAALAAAALVNAARTRAAEKAHPPLGRFVDVEGVRVHYLERGPANPVGPVGPPVVLIHGNGSMLQDFVISGVVDRLAQRHRVIVFDRPGSGYSERPKGQPWGPAEQAAVLVAAAAALGVERPVVVGHSWERCQRSFGRSTMRIASARWSSRRAIIFRRRVSMSSPRCRRSRRASAMSCAIRCRRSLGG